MGKRKMPVDVANDDKDHKNAVDEHGQRKSKKKKKKQKALLNGDEQYPVKNENNCKTKHDDVDLGMARPDQGDKLIEESKSDMKLKKKRKRKHNQIDNTSENDYDDNNSEGLKLVVSEISNGHVEDMSVTVGESPRKKSKKDKKQNKNSDNSLEGLENNGTGIVLVNGEVATDSRKDKKCKKKKKKQKDRIEDYNVESEEMNSKTITPDSAVTNSNENNHREPIIESCKNAETSANEVRKSQHRKKGKKNKKQKHVKFSLGEGAEENAERNDTVYEKASDSQKKENSIKGQWKTASFENSDRQDKFIRLLGGFKKGCDKQALTSKFNVESKENKPKADKSTEQDDQQRPNMAMTSVQEKLYSIALENQYEKAMNFNQKRGMGLGFEKPPGEGKKFYIDVKKAKSIKFDD